MSARTRSFGSATIDFLFLNELSGSKQIGDASCIVYCDAFSKIARQSSETKKKKVQRQNIGI